MCTAKVVLASRALSDHSLETRQAECRVKLAWAVAYRHLLVEGARTREALTRAAELHRSMAGCATAAGAAAASTTCTVASPSFFSLSPCFCSALALVPALASGDDAARAGATGVAAPLGLAEAAAEPGLTKTWAHLFLGPPPGRRSERSSVALLGIVVSSETGRLAYDRRADAAGRSKAEWTWSRSSDVDETAVKICKDSQQHSSQQL